MQILVKGMCLCTVDLENFSVKIFVDGALWFQYNIKSKIFSAIIFRHLYDSDEY